MHAAREDTNLLTPPRAVILTLTKAEAEQLQELMGWDMSIPSFLREMGGRGDPVTQHASDVNFMSGLHRLLATALEEP